MDVVNTNRQVSLVANPLPVHGEGYGGSQFGEADSKQRDMHDPCSVSVECSQILANFVPNDEDILRVCRKILVDAEVFRTVLDGCVPE
jgi:hypothetical protein